MNMLLTLIFLDKNSKESFIKKLQLCMKNYDYKDETKDVKGKVSLFSRLKKDQKLHISTIFSTNLTLIAID